MDRYRPRKRKPARVAYSAASWLVAPSMATIVKRQDHVAAQAMNGKSSTPSSFVAILLSCTLLHGACVTSSTLTTSADHDGSTQSTALLPAGDAGQ